MAVLLPPLLLAICSYAGHEPPLEQALGATSTVEVCAGAARTAARLHAARGQGVHAREAAVHGYSFPRVVEEAVVFSPAELERIFGYIALVEEGSYWMDAGLGSIVHDAKGAAHVPTGEPRVAQVIGLSKEDDVPRFLYKRVAETVQRLNQQYWQFPLAKADDATSSLVETMQLSKYPSPRAGGAAGHYAWHIDTGHTGSTAKRRLSVSVQLSEAAAYEGGDLQLHHGGPDAPSRNVSRAAGALIAFPSFSVHRITPVTKGTRYSLVAWFQEL
jgi:hypothetical protein